MKIFEILYESELLEQLTTIDTLPPQLSVPRRGVDEALKPQAVLWTSTARRAIGGQWTSDWAEWCRDRMAQWIGPVGYLYQVKPGARILVIRTDNDARRVAQHYGVKIEGTGVTAFMNLAERMPWDRIAQEWDAVHHTPGNRHRNTYMSTWDVESTAWFNRDALSEPQRVEVNHKLDEASGYIPSSRERNDPRFKTALTVDIKPDSIQQNARKLALGAVRRTGVPPTARSDGKVVKVAKSTK